MMAVLNVFQTVDQRVTNSAAEHSVETFISTWWSNTNLDTVLLILIRIGSVVIPLANTVSILTRTIV